MKHSKQSSLFGIKLTENININDKKQAIGFATSEREGSFKALRLCDN